MIEKIKLVLSALLLAAGIAGFYVLADKALVLRILVILAGLGAAISVLWTTLLGQTTRFASLTDSPIKPKAV